MDQEQRLSTLVYKASNLRDYLMHVQGEDSAELAHALSVFDRSDDFSAISDDDILHLRKAFQKAYDRLCLRIDSYTIGEVMIGKSPVERGTPILTSLLLCLAGLLLVTSVFNFTYWSNRATVAMADAQEFLAFDHSNEIAQLVEMKILFDKVVSEEGSDNLEPQLMYLEGISNLQQHYSRERELIERIQGLWSEAQVYRAPGQFVSNWSCARAANTVVIKATLDPIFRCSEKEAARAAAAAKAAQREEELKKAKEEADAKAAAEAAAEAALIAAGNAEVQDSATDAETMQAIKVASVFDNRFTAVKNAQVETMKTANRTALNIYQDTLDAMGVRIKDLREWLNTIHLWALPILYGMLGSIVYCMWRVLNPSVAPLGFFYSFMRTIFAGLAAMTLSMLLVPSNILTAGVELNRPLIYLLSFVFGYSVEVFINTLNMFNTYFLANLTTRERQDAK